MAERTVGAWTVTIVAAKLRAAGALLLCRLLGPPLQCERFGLAAPRLSLADEHGHKNRTWPGGNNGIRDPHGQHVRGTYLALVPPGTPELHVSVDEIRIKKPEVDPNDPMMARSVVAASVPFDWDLTVPPR